MSEAISFFNHNMVWVQLSLILILLALLFAVAGQVKTYKKLLEHYRALMAAYPGKDLEGIITGIHQQQGTNDREIKEIKGRLNSVEAWLPDDLRRVALSRFKAFPDVGGDMSFALALLTDRGDGVVVSGIHGRDDCRVYVKGVQQFVSEYALSEEEKKVIQKAKNLR
ncbi:MAG: DUF4446 family protein [Solirubrobacterales bacterium]